MGGIQLGVLLGAFDRAQSFDVDSAAIATGVNSWEKVSGQSSLFFDTEVHSSGQGLRVFADSDGGTTVLRYRYGLANDAHLRWFTEVTTHNARLTGWARASVAAGSGWLKAVLAGSGGTAEAAIAYAAALQPFRLELEGITNEGLFPEARIDWAIAPASAATLYLDDLVLQADAIALYPELELRDVGGMNAGRHQTLGGRRGSWLWSTWPAWEIPLQHVPGSHAAQINQWWQQGLPLALTLDSSDTAALHLVRLAHAEQPFSRRARPYTDVWQGTLRLEGLHDGRLSF